VIADAAKNIVIQVDSNGGQTVIASNLQYPNGVTVDLHGYVYVSEQEGGRINQINPSTKEIKLLASGFQNPNGISFSPDYRTLYVVDFGGGTVHQIQFDENRNSIGDASLFVENLTSPNSGLGKGTEFDGVAVDACGNVYVTEFVAAVIWRVTPDKQYEVIANFSEITDWIPNLHWGSGIGNWDRNKLYVMNRNEDQVFALDVGIPGKPMPQF